MAIRETITGVTYDELIGGHEVTAIKQNITIEAGSALARGSIVTAAGKLVGTSDTADYVVAEAVGAADTVATVYASGMFNREKLIVAEEDTVDAHEAQLRDKNIYLTSIKN